MKKLVIIQTATPDYRDVFFTSIYNNLKDNFKLYSGDSYFEDSVKSSYLKIKKPIKNNFFLKRKLLFQTGIWHLIFTDVVLVLEMNPRIISNWIFLVVRKIFRKKTVLWGHAWPRKGKGSKSDLLRGLMRSLGTRIIVYTKEQEKELKSKMPKKNISSAPNSVISKDKMLTNSGNESLNLVYVGRLTKAKKPFFLVKAFHKSISKYPSQTKLIIIGDGNQRKKIENYVIKNNLEAKIKIKGHINKYEILKEIYFNCFFSISPGYAGLSITQSFGFGVPILISKDEKHSPEIEAIKVKYNALYYETDSEKDFNRVLLNAYQNKKYWLSQRKSIVEFCKKEYSVEAMAKVFIDLCR